VIQSRLADGLMARILAREPRYDERAYLFILSSIEFLQARLPARRHVSGQELAGAVRDHALEQFGLMSRAVFGHWGLHETLDIGRVVFILVEVGLLITQPTDRPEDFAEVYDFGAAFDDWTYSWQGLGDPRPEGGASRREVL
jgi:uncharacterized repeat protein (TIGR04138 family)